MTEARKPLVGRIRGLPLVRVLVVYAVASWVVVQVVSIFASHFEHYTTLLELWSDCDPELRPQVQSARRALERLGAERPAGSG